MNISSDSRVKRFAIYEYVIINSV